MSQNIRPLGEIGSNLLSELSLQEKRLFTIEEAAKIYRGNKNGLRRLLSRLVKRRWLQRIERGKYLILPLAAGNEGEWTEHEFIIASYLIKPYYIGFRSALNYYGYTEQASKTIFVASVNRKLRSSVEILGVTYRFVYLPQRKFFGITEMSIENHRVNVSDKEKTIVDCLDRLEYCGGISEVAKALWYGRDELDPIKIAKYAIRNGNKAVIQRLGYLLESLGYETEEATALLQDSTSNSYAPLDTLAPLSGQYIEKWKVVLNVLKNELLQWKKE